MLYSIACFTCNWFGRVCDCSVGSCTSASTFSLFLCVETATYHQIVNVSYRLVSLVSLYKMFVHSQTVLLLAAKLEVKWRVCALFFCIFMLNGLYFIVVRFHWLLMSCARLSWLLICFEHKSNIDISCRCSQTHVHITNNKISLQDTVIFQSVSLY